MQPSYINVQIPNVGDTKDLTVVEVLVQSGSTVKADEPVIVLESDKASLEIPTGFDGTIHKLSIAVGDIVNEGDVFCVLSDIAGVNSSGSTSRKTEETNGKIDSKSVVQTITAYQESKPLYESAPCGENNVASEAISDMNSRGTISTNPASVVLPKAGPAIRKLARLLGVNLAEITGSGKHSRIVKEDIEAYVRLKLSREQPAENSKADVPALPEIDFSKFGPIEVIPLKRIQRISSTHLHRAWLSIPHVTQFESADITDLDSFRTKANEQLESKLTLLPLLMKAVCLALTQFPQFNASLSSDGKNIIYKKYMNIGFAADTNEGLVVPIIKDVDRKGIRQIAQECSNLAEKARNGKLSPSEMNGGCFSISSLGGIGVRGGFTPIVNSPEVAILGVSRSSIRPVWINESFVPRLILPLSLSYDHRAIDGALGSRFLLNIVKHLENTASLLL